VLGKPLCVESAEVSLGVADVDREEHAAIIAGSATVRRARSPRSA
jgi:hypothetical protein